MSSTTWRGDAPAIAQVQIVQVTGYDVTTTYKITMNGKVVSTVGTGGSVSTTAAALQVLLAASAIPEFKEVTWTVSTDTITATAGTAGKPFTFTKSVSGGAGTLGSIGTTTASSGPNHYDTAANWSAGAVPTTEDVYIQNSSVSILYGLSQSGNTLNSLNVDQSFTGTIGLPITAGSGTSSYAEYRTLYLTQEATTINVGNGLGAGSGRIKVNVGSVVCTLNVLNSGPALESASGVKAILWKGTHANNVVNISKGSLGIAVFAGEVATIATLRESYQTSVSGDSDVKLGSGVTLGVVDKQGGRLEVNGAFTTLTNVAGDVTMNGTGALTTATLYGGALYYRSTGTLGTGNVFNGGTLDFTQDQRPRTVSNCTVYEGATLNDPDKTVTFSANIIVKGQLSAVKLNLGYAITVARS